MTLKQFIGWNPVTKKAKRGAISRVAAHLGVSWTTIPKWISGEYQMGIEMRRKVQDMIHARIDIRARHKSRPH